MNIASVYRRKYRPHSSVNTKNDNLPNHLKYVQIDRQCHTVATDITYIYTQKHGWVY